MCEYSYDYNIELEVTKVSTSFDELEKFLYSNKISTNIKNT